MESTRIWKYHRPGNIYTKPCAIRRNAIEYNRGIIVFSEESGKKYKIQLSEIMRHVSALRQPEEMEEVSLSPR